MLVRSPLFLCPASLHVALRILFVIVQNAGTTEQTIAAMLIESVVISEFNANFSILLFLGRRYGGASTSLGTGASDLSRSRSSHALKARESSPLRSSTAASTGDDKDGAALSSWARYLKNKYGNRTTKDSPRDTAAATTTTPTPSSSSSASASAARRLSLGLPLRQANEVGSSDDDSKNALGSPTTTT